MLAPALQQVFGIQQDVHAFREKERDHARVSRLALIVVTTLAGSLQPSLMLRMDPDNELAGPIDRRQRVTLEVFQTTTQQLLRGVQQLRLGQIHRNQIGLEFLDHFFQRGGNLSHWKDPGHVRATLEGMQRSLQSIGDRLRQALRAIGEEVDQRTEVGFRLVTKDLQQLRIQHFFSSRFRSGRLIERYTALRTRIDRLTFGKRVGIGGQPIDIVALTLCLGGKFLDQCRHQRDHVGHQLLHRLIGIDAPVEHPIEQILHRPGEFADDQRTHHASAALERMEGSPHFTECVLVGGIGAPARQVLVDGFEYFGRFLDEDFEQVFIDRLFTLRRWQQAWRNVLCRRIDRYGRRCHDVFHAQNRFDGQWLLHRFRQDHFWDIELCHFGLAPIHRIAGRVVGSLLVNQEGIAIGDVFRRGRKLEGHVRQVIGFG